MKPRAYATAEAFKAALDQRLRNVAEPGVGIITGLRDLASTVCPAGRGLLTAVTPGT